MKFKVGDKVKIREDLSLGKYYSVNLSRSMLLNKGKEAKITYISPDDDTCHLDIDGDDWWWSEDMLEPYTSKIAKKDLRDGDYCVFKNGDKAIKIGNYVGTHNVVVPLREYNNKLEHNYDSNYDIVRVDRPTKYKTIYKNDEILDSTEKKYLAGVIRPFKDKIKTIAKELDIGHGDLCYLNISLENNDCANLPSFYSKAMYVGMEVDKEYTLEELGL